MNDYKAINIYTPNCISKKEARMKQKNVKRDEGIEVKIDVSKPLAKIISNNYKLLKELAKN